MSKKNKTSDNPQTGNSSLGVVRESCPCLHLDEPCQLNCTCVNGFSSAGCRYCCTYGSKEQKKMKAKWIKEKIERHIP